MPERFTKELRLQSNAETGERRLRISSNLLPMMGFGQGAAFERRVLAPGAGFEFRLSPHGSTKVYTRAYHQRKNFPFETVIDYKSQQSFLNAALPAFAERVHLTFTRGCIIGRPVCERTFHIRRAVADPRHPMEAFVALSSGVDAACLRRAGFGMQGLLEYRPREKRDTTDLSETGVITALANNAFRLVFNEDIYRIDFAGLRSQLAGQPPVSLLAISPQCDDFSFCKGPSLKLRHLQSLDTTVDMVYEVLRLVETVEPAVVHVENTPGFGSSSAGELLALKLRRWGYFVNSGVYDARDYGSATSRKRFYLVASVYPGFVPPAPITRSAQAGTIWRLIEDQLPHCRDATHTSSLQDGLTTGRARLITSESAHAPTILKSQNRHAKDSIFIQTTDGRYLFPNETILRRLQGLPEDFVLDCVGQEIAAEVIGQSIAWELHHAFAAAIARHIREFRGEAGPIISGAAAVPEVAAAPSSARVGQGTFDFGSAAH